MSKLLFPLQLKRQYSGPIDPDSVFDTTADMTAYLNNPLRYAGQIVTCKEQEGVVFVLNNAMTEWKAHSIEGSGTAGEDGFTPIPEITTDANGTYLNFIVGYKTVQVDIGGGDMVDTQVPIYAWATPVNIKGDSSSSGGGGGNVAFDSDFTVKGVSQGLYNDGVTIPSGTNLLEVVKKMLTAVINPTYVSPTLAFSTANVLMVESDTTISPVFNTIFTKNNAGDLTAFRIKENGTAILTDTAITSPYTVTPYKIVDQTKTYLAEVDYAIGEVLKNNLGENYPSGQIQAGTKTSSSIVFKAVRKYFHGSDTTSDTALATSADVRALTGVLNPVVGTTFTISVPVGAKKVTFAYPETLQDPSSVKYVEGMNAEIKGIFTKTVVSVEGAEGGNAVNYKVFTYVPAQATTAAITYTVTI